MPKLSTNPKADRNDKVLKLVEQVLEEMSQLHRLVTKALKIMIETNEHIRGTKIRPAFAPPNPEIDDKIPF